MSRTAVMAACVLLASPSGGRSAPAPALPPAASVTVSYSVPLAGRIVVVHAFEAPPTPYAAGHRGVDLRTSAGTTVLAAGSGRVRFAGPVAGRGVVVIAHSDGVSTEYEPVIPLVSAGALVERGQPIGRVRGSHRECPPDGCLHWGARRNGNYFDPMSLLRQLGPIRLLPWITTPAELSEPHRSQAARHTGRSVIKQQLRPNLEFRPERQRDQARAPPRWSPVIMRGSAAAHSEPRPQPLLGTARVDQALGWARA